MNQQLTGRPRGEESQPNPLDRNRRVFLLARAQLASGRTEASRVDAARRRWPSHRRRFD
jgi:hypothetical protein